MSYLVKTSHMKVRASSQMTASFCINSLEIGNCSNHTVIAWKHIAALLQLPSQLFITENSFSPYIMLNYNNLTLVFLDSMDFQLFSKNTKFPFIERKLTPWRIFFKKIYIHKILMYFCKRYSKNILSSGDILVNARSLCDHLWGE